MNVFIIAVLGPFSSELKKQNPVNEIRGLTFKRFFLILALKVLAVCISTEQFQKCHSRTQFVYR